MVSKTSIVRNLKMLDVRYRQATSQKDALFFSKLALLELCGWIEESMDDIVLRCSRRHLHEQENRTYCSKRVVKPTYGFDYREHFRQMLMRTIGLIGVEKLERRLGPQTVDQFAATLASLKMQRNAEAHTHLKGVTRTIAAPSVTLNMFSQVHAGLVAVDEAIRAKVW